MTFPDKSWTSTKVFTGMGSMYRLSYLIRIKDPKEEKALIDELRTKNGNLEISILPYSEQQPQL